MALEMEKFCESRAVQKLRHRLCGAGSCERLMTQYRGLSYSTTNCSKVIDPTVVRRSLFEMPPSWP